MVDQQLTSDDIVTRLADRAGLTVEQVRRFLQAQAELASELVGHGYPLPGIGLLTKFEAPARTITLAFGPDAGKEHAVSASRKLKFWISPAIKDVVISGRPKMADVFAVDWYWPRDNHGSTPAE